MRIPRNHAQKLVGLILLLGGLVSSRFRSKPFRHRLSPFRRFPIRLRFAIIAALVLSVVFSMSQISGGWSLAVTTQTTPPSDISVSVHALFDLTTPTVGPFPADQFTLPDVSHITGHRINLPKPNCEERPTACEDIDNINALDGFNLQPRLTVAFDGPIDLSTVTSQTVFLISLQDMRGGDAGGEVIGINQIVWDPEANRLYAESDELLRQHTRYALIVTRGVRDEAGVPIEATRAFRRFRKLVRGHYKRALLEGIRAAHRIGVRETDIATASVFTTQSVTAVLEKIRDQIKAATPEPANFVINGVRTVFPLEALSAINVRPQTGVSPPTFTNAPVNLRLLDFVPGAVSTVAFGTFHSPDYQTPEKVIPPVGTLTGDPRVQGTKELVFCLILPAGAKPNEGWPVAIYGHGGGATREHVFNVASMMAAHGFATIGINIVGHGFGELSEIQVSQTDGSRVSFPAGGRGLDQDNDNVIGNNEGFDAVVAPFTIITNRDGLRQAVVDLMQLVRMVQVGLDVDGDGSPDLDSSSLAYFGVSQGGIYGIDFLAVDPDVRLGVPVVPGGSRVEFRRLSPLNRIREARLLAEHIPSLINFPGLSEIGGIPIPPPHFNENLPLRNQPPLINSVAGAIEIQEFLEKREWIEQSGDPVSYARHLQREPLPGVPAKPVFIQFARTDQDVPNPTTTAILRAGHLAHLATYFRNDLAFAENPAVPKNPHGFLISIGNPAIAAVAAGAQQQIAVFFASGGRAIIHPDPARFFEVPVVPPLPEGIEFIR